MRASVTGKTWERCEMFQGTTTRAVPMDPLWVVDVFFGVSAVRFVPAAVRGCAEKMRPIAEMY